MKTYGQLGYTERKDALERMVGWWGLRATPHVMIKAKRIFPRAEGKRSGTLLMQDTREVARDLEWLIERYPVEIDPETRHRLRARAQEHRDQTRLIDDILTGRRPHLPFVEPARPAREYQLVAADLALSTGRLLLGDDVGLGKTMSSLLVLRNPDALPALVVCLTHLPKQWEEELALTLPWLRAHIVRSLTPYDPATRRELRGHDPDVLIMGYAKLRGWGDALAGRVRTVIFDEVQELRRVDSDKYTAAAQIADGAAFRLGLSATPVYNYGGEIHNILSVLAPDELGTREEFAREWCGGRWSDKVTVDDPAGLGLYLRDQGLMLRRTRAEVGRELPHGDPVKIPHWIESDGDVFEELAAEAVELAEMIVARARPAQELFRAAGDFDWKMRQATGIAKAPYVAEFVRLLLESERKVILFGWHRAVYDVWLDRLGDFNPVLYTGSESPPQKERSKQRFLTDDACRLFIMSLRSGAGLDGLQQACNIGVFGELDWAPPMHDQCIGRYARDGQEHEALAYFLHSEHGTDPPMLDTLQIKRMQSEPLRDPHAPLYVAAEDTKDRVRRLAADLLANRAGRRAA